jgi:putative membrane protein
MFTSTQLRIWNEVATIFLFAIVFLVVIKTNLSFLTGFIGLAILVVLLMLGIKLYKLVRKD